MSPPCAAVGGCDNPAVVVWTRRPTDTEMAPLIALEEQRRAEALALADPQLPPPDFGPLSTAADTTVPVYACGPHAIAIDLAALVHQSTCTAPNAVNLPGCDCTPESLPPPDPAMLAGPAPSPSLPDHWLPEAS